MTSVRGNLSAITPPQSRNSTIGIEMSRQHLAQRGGRVGDLENRERQRDAQPSCCRAC